METRVGPSEVKRLLEPMESGIGPSNRLRVADTMASGIGPSKRLRMTGNMETATIHTFENYHVFISHRGPDTKTGFVSFLYEGLVAAGLQPFLDCKSIDTGEDTWQCIDHAIETTPIALIVFSETFAESEWCLKELHLLLDTPSVQVLPIFYNVQPSEVRFPEKGKFSDGFQKLVKRHDKTIVEQWRADLRKASKLFGWEHSGAHKSSEGELVKKIVGKVLELANKPLPLDVGDYVVGVKQVAQKIIHNLNDQKKTLMLGLWGMGGIGKSTLARELYNQLRYKYTTSCYVEDVAEKVILGGVAGVQNNMLKDLCMSESNAVTDKSKGKIILEERLCKKKVLVVLDDVRDNEAMDYWITREMLTECSLCIVTSRDKRVFEKSKSFDSKLEIYIHNVQVLNKEDSRQVFTSYAGGGMCKVKELEELVENISTACGGVPLVLKICGALLKEEENVEIWEEVFKMLKSGGMMDDNKIFECLRMSYDALQEQHQEMFLDIACALRGQSEDMAVRVWKSHGWYAALGVRSLKEKALVTVDEHGCFTMHDLLRDLGREIVRKRRGSEGVCRRLWMPESLTLLQDEGLPDSLQTLVLLKNHYYINENGTSTVTLDLSHMKELRILICDDAVNVTSVPKNLLWLSMHKHGARKEDNIESVVGNGETFRIGNIFSIAPKNNKLVVLDISHSCHSFTSITDKIYFRYLQVLRYRYCDYPQMFLGDEIFQSKDLEVLDLSYCPKLYLPDNLGSLRNLSSLNLTGCHYDLKVLRNALIHLTKLKNLRLKGCRQLFVDGISSSTTTIPVLEIRNLCPNLCHLDLGDSWKLESLPESFGEQSNLEELSLSPNELIKLPDSFGNLKKLKNLTLGSSVIKSLPDSFGKLSNLEVLQLYSCYKLTMLPDSFGSLNRLKSLRVLFSGIESLPKTFGRLSNLEKLVLFRCSTLRCLPDSFGSLVNLWDLDLAGCGIETLPESFVGLSNLKVLNLENCRNFSLNHCLNSFRNLRNLTHLRVGGTRIDSLPTSFGELSSLEILNMKFCRNLKKLPDSFGDLRNLRKLNLLGSKLMSLPESFGALSNLQQLNLHSCQFLEALPQSFTQLTSLQELNLGNCPKELWRHFYPLRHLMSVNRLF